MGEQVAIFGQGIVGLLLTALISRLAPVVPGDPGSLSPAPSALRRLGAHVSLDPSTPEAMGRLAAALQAKGPCPGADLCYEISGNPVALDQAIAATGSAAGWSSAPGTGQAGRPEPGGPLSPQPDAAHQQSG